MQAFVLPAVLKSTRAHAGLSVSEVARRIGVNRVTVDRWENGERHPGFDQVLRWCEATRTDPASLMQQLSNESGVTSPVSHEPQALPHAASPLASLTADDIALLRRIGFALTAAADMALDTLARRPVVPATPDAGPAGDDDDQ